MILSWFRKVKQITEEVRELADQAQTDVGYDYIWLADVTYHDWQRYHDLIGSECSCTLYLLICKCRPLMYLILRIEQFHGAGKVNSERFSSFASH